MKANFKYLTAFVAAGSLLFGFASVAQGRSKEVDKKNAPSLDAWSFGNEIIGKMPSKSEMKGKVVLVEYWGTHCPPCIASLPHMARLHKKWEKQGLIVIGAESQGSSKPEIEKMIKKAGVEYPICEGAEGPVSVSGIPHAFVFGRDGKLVFDGSPSDDAMETAISKELRADGDADDNSDKPVFTARPNTILFNTQIWTNLEGKQIVAAVRNVTDTQVTFLMPNNSEIVYPLDKLSVESREILSAKSKTNQGDAGAPASE